MQKLFLSTLIVVLATTSIVLAQESSCGEMIETALESVGSACSDLGRNEVCYGNHMVTAHDFQQNSLREFVEVGDILPVFDIASIETMPLDADGSIWGIALLSLQANLPDTVPGQSVTFVVFGDAELTNQVPTKEMSLSLTGTSTGNINVRSGAGANFAVLGTLLPSQSVTIISRNDAIDWVEIEFGDDSGWVFASLLEINGDISALPLGANTSSASSEYAAMQAFSLRTGVGEPTCTEAPRDGILVQAPSSTTVNFTINGVDVVIGSTAYLETSDDALNVSTFDGLVTVAANGKTQAVEPGFMTSATADEAPLESEVYNYAELKNLPIDLLPEPIVIPIPVDGNSDWVNTGIELSAGDTITLTASGTMNYWLECPTQKYEAGFPDIDCASLFMGPDGGFARFTDGEIIFSPDDLDRFPAPDMQVHALIGRVGDEVFEVGESVTYTANADGVLALRVNDLDDNNEGVFLVNVELPDSE